MAIRKVKRATTPASDEKRPEAERPEAAGKPEVRSAESRTANSEKPAAREPERQNGGGNGVAQSDRKPEGRSASITITFPSYSFAPVKYGSFAVPSVSMTVDMDAASAANVQTVADVTCKELRELQESLFTEELAGYLRRTEIAYEAAQQRFGD